MYAFDIVTDEGIKPSNGGHWYEQVEASEPEKGAQRKAAEKVI